MVRVRLRALAARASFSVAALLCTATAAVAQSATTHFQWDVGAGREVQTSPLFQMSPESTILYLDDVQRLESNFLRAAVQGSIDWALPSGTSISVGASANLKRSPDSSAMDFGTVAISPSVHTPFGGASVGATLNLQSIAVGTKHFRDVTGVQVDWTRTDASSLWGIVAEVAQYRHDGELSDLDADALSVVFLRQYTQPFAGVEGLDFSAILGREVNVHGYQDLSQHSAMFSVAVRWNALGGQWTVGKSWRRVRFDDTPFDGEPVRDDLTSMTDVSWQYELTQERSIHFELNHVRNASTTQLFDNEYRQFGVTLRSSF